MGYFPGVGFRRQHIYQGSDSVNSTRFRSQRWLMRRQRRRPPCAPSPQSRQLDAGCHRPPQGRAAPSPRPHARWPCAWPRASGTCPRPPNPAAPSRAWGCCAHLLGRRSAVAAGARWAAAARLPLPVTRPACDVRAVGGGAADAALPSLQRLAAADTGLPSRSPSLGSLPLLAQCSFEFTAEPIYHEAGAERLLKIFGDLRQKSW